MANYMSQVAKMLGVELGEYFEINKHDGIFVLCYDGLFHTQAGVMCPELLSGLLSKKYTIKRKPWKPERGETYWYVEKDGDIWEREWHPCRYMSKHMNRYKLGNCYRTREEAETNRDKWVAFYASDEVFEL